MPGVRTWPSRRSRWCLPESRFPKAVDLGALIPHIGEINLESKISSAISRPTRADAANGGMPAYSRARRRSTHRPFHGALARLRIPVATDGVPGAVRTALATFTYDFIVRTRAGSPSRDVGGAGGVRLVRRATVHRPGWHHVGVAGHRARLERYRHGFFQVLDPRGVPVRPLAWKDTVNVPHDESVRILVRSPRAAGQLDVSLSHPRPCRRRIEWVRSKSVPCHEPHAPPALICICSSPIAVDSAQKRVRHLASVPGAPADHQPPHARDPVRGGGHHRGLAHREMWLDELVGHRARCAFAARSLLQHAVEPHPRLWYLCSSSR